MRGNVKYKWLLRVLIFIFTICIFNVSIYAEEEYSGGPEKLIYDYIGHYSLNYTGNTNHYDYWNSNGTGKLVSRNYKDRTDVSTKNNSSATISQTDSESTIKKAILIWQSRAEDAPNTEVKLIMPSNIYWNISAEEICQDTRTNANGEEYVGVYTMCADVTDLVCSDAGGYGTYTVANIPVWDGVQAGEVVCGGESVASWQLVYVEESPNFPLRTISLNLLSQYFFNIDYAVTVHFRDASSPNGDVSAQFLDGSIDVDAAYRYDGIGYPDDYNYEYEGSLFRYFTPTRGLYKNGVCFNNRDTGVVGQYGVGAVGGTRVHLFDDYRRTNGALSQTTVYRWKDKNMGINVFLQGVAIDVFSYDIVFDGNGADSGSMDDLYCIYGRGYHLPENQYHKEHYKLGSWNTKADGSGTRYNNRGYIRNLTDREEKITLYAQWVPNAYRIILDNQGAIVRGTKEYYEWYAKGNYTSSDCTKEISKITIPEKVGFVFEGYYTEADGKGTQYVDDAGNILSGSTTFEEDTTLYAYWTPAVYKVTLDNQGAQTAGTTAYYEKFGAGNYTTEDCTTIITQIEKPVKNHAAFKGYFTEKNGEGNRIIDADGMILDVYTIFTEDTTLYACWEPEVFMIALDQQNPTKPGTGAYYERYGVENFVKIIDSSVIPEEVTRQYDYTGSVQTFIAPHTGTYELQLYGASGYGEERWESKYDWTTKEYKDVLVNYLSVPALTTGTIDLVEGERLYIYVGGMGSETAGGFNGGGDGRTIYSTSTFTAKVAGGGGATDVRYGGTSLSDRIIVSAGAGGATYYINGASDTDISTWKIARGNPAGETLNYQKFQNMILVLNDSMALPGAFGYTPEQEFTSEFIPNLENAGTGVIGTVYQRRDNYSSFYSLTKITAKEVEKGSFGTGVSGGGGGWYGGGLTIYNYYSYDSSNGSTVNYDQSSGGISGSSYVQGVDNGVIWYTGTEYLKDNSDAQSESVELHYGNGCMFITFDSYHTFEQKTTSITLPQKEGYTFGGYFTEKDGQGTQYVDADGNILSTPTTFEEDTTLYAYWIADASNTYKIVFNGNGADAGRMDGMTCEFDKEYILNENQFKRAGYMFAGWSLEADGAVIYTDKASVKNLAAVKGEVVTLYAKWLPGEASYKVKHYTEKLYGGYELYDSGTKQGITGEVVELAAQRLQINGFTYNYAEIKGDQIDEAVILSDGSLEINLYYSRNSYEVLLEKDSGIASVSGEGSYRFEEPVTVKTDVLPGYTWYGWSGTYNALEQTYEFIMPAEDVTLKANTSPLVYTVYLENQMAEKAGTMAYYEKYGVGNFKEKECMAGITAIELPEKTGYLFKGYYTGEEGAGIQYVTADGTILSTATTFTEDTVLYAYWTPVTYTIHFDGNGATGGSMNDMVCAYNESYQLPKNRFTRNAYSFVGWNTKSDGSGFSYMDKSQVDNLCSEEGGVITLYAQWAANVYIVEFDANGGEGTMEQMVCEFYKDYTLPANQFTKTGHCFAGWSLVPDGEALYSDEAVINNLFHVKGIIRLYAQWKPSTYEVYFDANGGDGTMDAIILFYDMEQCLPVNEFTKRNEYGPSTFLGWNTDAAATAAIFTDEALVKNLPGSESGSVMLYAIWDDCPWIIAEDLYYSLYEAQNDLITYEELMSKAVASDKEDGASIQPGIDAVKGTSFTIVDYLPTDFTQFTAGGSVTETYQVIDSAGNRFKQMITVHVVDTTPVEILPGGTTRFINEKYYNEIYENGGLEADSVWKTDPEFVVAIQQAFDNLNSDTPIMSFSFTYEEILEMKEFIRINGIGNSKNPDALQQFYDTFMVLNYQEE